MKPRHYNRRAVSKKDGNHDSIVAHYESLGCSVAELHMVGAGVPDLLVGCLGRNHLREVKNPDGENKVYEAQIDFSDLWRGGEVKIIRTMEDVVEDVQEMRRG